MCGASLLKVGKLNFSCEQVNISVIKIFLCSDLGMCTVDGKNRVDLQTLSEKQDVSKILSTILDVKTLKRRVWET